MASFHVGRQENCFIARIRSWTLRVGWMRPFHQTSGVASGWLVFALVLFSFMCRHTYSDQLSEGPQLLRPYHLAWRGDFGLSAILEPDEMYTLAELYLTNGFLDSCVLECILNVTTMIENSHCLLLLQVPHRFRSPRSGTCGHHTT